MASQLRRAAGGDPAEMPAVAEASAMWAGVTATPFMVMGGTDGRLLRQAGIPTYGVQGIFYDAGDIRRHGRDEPVGVLAFDEGQEFLYRLVTELAR